MNDETIPAECDYPELSYNEQNKQKRETASVEIDLSAYLKAVEDSRNE